MGNIDQHRKTQSEIFKILRKKKRNKVNKKVKFCLGKQYKSKFKINLPWGIVQKQVQDKFPKASKKQSIKSFLCPQLSITWLADNSVISSINNKTLMTGSSCKGIRAALNFSDHFFKPNQHTICFCLTSCNKCYVS